MLGYSNIRDYAAKEGGLREAQCRAFLKIGARLDDLPLMREALEKGSLSWHKASLIVNQVDPEREAELIAVARSLTTSRLRNGPLDQPVVPPHDTTASLPPSTSAAPQARTAARPQPEPPDPMATPKVLTQEQPAADQDKPGSGQTCHFCHFTLKFTPEQYALVSRLLEAAKGKTKEQKILDALAAENGKNPRTTLPYLLVIMQCPSCGMATIPSNRGEIAVPKPLLEAAHCDAAIEDPSGNRRRTIPPRLRRQALQRARFSCEARNCTHTQFLEVHHRRPTAAGGTNSLDNLIVLCSHCHRRLHENEELARMALKHAP